MAETAETMGSRLSRAARFLGINGWVVAVLGVMAAILAHSSTALLLGLLLFVTWQVVYVTVQWAARRVRSKGKSRLRLTVTSWGGLYALVTLVFVVLSAQWGINLFSLTASFLLAGLASSVALALLGVAGLAVRWRTPEHIFAGEPFEADLELTNEKRWLAAQALRVAGTEVGSAHARAHLVWQLPAGRSAHVDLPQVMTERGRHRMAPVRVSSGFPFGLTQANLWAEPEEQVLVLPRLGRIDEEEFSRQFGGTARWLTRIRRKDEHGEFRSLREYQPGDDPRQIHWRTSARLRKLHVREFEKLEAQSVLILLDASRPHGPGRQQAEHRKRFERAISFVATLAALLNSRNAFFAFASFCPDMVALPYRSGRGPMFALLETLATARTTPRRSVEDLLQTVHRSEVRGGLCLVTPGPMPDSGTLKRLGPGAVCVDVSRPEFDELFTTKA